MISNNHMFVSWKQNVWRHSLEHSRSILIGGHLLCIVEDCEKSAEEKYNDYILQLLFKIILKCTNYIDIMFNQLTYSQCSARF